MMSIFLYVISELYENRDLIELIIDTVKDGKLTKDEIKAAVKRAITEAYDQKVKIQMGLVP